MTPEPLAFIGTCDLAGLVRGKSLPLAELPKRRAGGVGITPSNLLLSVFGPIYDTPFGTQGDLMLVPDAATETAIPARDAPEIHLLLGDFHTLDGAPYWDESSAYAFTLEQVEADIEAPAPATPDARVSDHDAAQNNSIVVTGIRRNRFGAT